METQKQLDTVIKLIKYMTIPVFAWPLPVDASRKLVLVRDIAWWILIINVGYLTSIFFIDIYWCALKGHKIDHAIKIFAELSAVFLMGTVLLLAKTEESRLRDLLDELRAFVDHANKEELDVIQGYLDRTMFINQVNVFACILGPLAYILEPTVSANTILPLYVRYPFPLDATWALALTYLSQTIAIIQIGAMVVADSIWAMVMWYTGAKFEILSIQLGRASTHEHIKNCIREHQSILEYVERLKIPVRLSVTLLLAICSVAILAGGLVLMGYLYVTIERTIDQLTRGLNIMLIKCGNYFMHVMEMQRPPIFVVIKFTCFELAATMRLFMFSWPADNLKSMSARVAVATFECDWVGKSPAMLKDMLFLMHRSQDPVVLALPGITDALTLEFYTGIMKAILSYLLTLNAMLDA